MGSSGMTMAIMTKAKITFFPGNFVLAPGDIDEAKRLWLERAAMLKELRHDFLALPQTILSIASPTAAAG